MLALAVRWSATIREKCPTIGLAGMFCPSHTRLVVGARRCLCTGLVQPKTKNPRTPVQLSIAKRASKRWTQPRAWSPLPSPCRSTRLTRFARTAGIPLIDHAAEDAVWLPEVDTSWQGLLLSQPKVDTDTHRSATCLRDYWATFWRRPPRVETATWQALLADHRCRTRPKTPSRLSRRHRRGHMPKE